MILVRSRLRQRSSMGASTLKGSFEGCVRIRTGIALPPAKVLRPRSQCTTCVPQGLPAGPPQRRSLRRAAAMARSSGKPNAVAAKVDIAACASPESWAPEQRAHVPSTDIRREPWVRVAFSLWYEFHTGKAYLNLGVVRVRVFPKWV